MVMDIKEEISGIFVLLYDNPVVYFLRKKNNNNSLDRHEGSFIFFVFVLLFIQMFMYEFNCYQSDFVVVVVLVFK